jgi:hypothetical protein
VIKSRRVIFAGNEEHMRDMINAYTIFVGKPECKRLLGRHRRRWEDNIEMNLKELGCDDVH